MTVNHLDQDGPGDALVESASSDREAFGLLYDQLYPAIFAYTLRRLIVRAVAEDVTSEVFLKVAASIRCVSDTKADGIDRSGPTTVEDFRRWLFRIATNEINAHLRQSIRRRELLEEAVHMGRISAAVSTTLVGQNAPIEWADVYQALGDLSDQEHSIISLRFFGGLKHDQIGDVLSIKPGTVRVALSRALDKLREGLQEPPRTESDDANNERTLPFGSNGGGN